VSRIVQEDVRGRLDVLAFRLAERWAAQRCPDHWPVLAPHFRKACEQLQPLNGHALGVLPLVPIAIALGGATIGGWLGWEWMKSREQSGAVDMPAPYAPPAPAAPQTEEELRNWNPDLLAKRDAEAWRRWAASPFPDLPQPKNSAAPWLWIGAGALALILLLKR